MKAIEYGNATAMDMTNNYERAVDPASLMTAIMNDEGHLVGGT